MKKLLYALQGFLLALGNIRVFSLDRFAGKRIAVIGPASSAFQTGKGAYIDSFDLVIRINKSALTVDAGKHPTDIGSRTDVEHGQLGAVAEPVDKGLLADRTIGHSWISCGQTVP